VRIAYFVGAEVEMAMYEEWLATVPLELTGDPLWQTKAYRLALFANTLAWHDVSNLVQDRRAIGLADQLYRASGSIAANLAEGYSHRSGKDQARFYEYSLGSAREARVWYYQARHLLSEAVVEHRLRLLTDIVRLLLTMIPAERGYKLTEERTVYEVVPTDLLADPPLP
jgi:four helix bundle protein